MLVVVSPAKNLNAQLDLSEHKNLKLTQPQFKQELKKLVALMQNFAPHELAKLQHTNDKIAELNFTRWQGWQDDFDLSNSLPSSFAFAGPVFQNLDAFSLNEQQLKRAQKQLRIISGLYGILRPLDLMQNYRLEMGTKLSFENYKSLYDFWGDRLVENLMQEFAEDEDKSLINLASNEYFKAIAGIKKRIRVIDIEFKQLKAGKYKTVVIYTKMARGQMARHIIENQLETPESIKSFDWQGYEFNPTLSNTKTWTFTREHP